MKRALQIGFFYGYERPNLAQTVLLQLAQGLSKRDHKVSLFHYEDQKPPPAKTLGKLKSIALNTKLGAHDFASARKLAKELEKKRIDVLFFANHDEASFLVTTKFLNQNSFKLVFLQNESLARIRKDFLNAFRFNQIDLWISPLQCTANEVRAISQLSDQKVQVLKWPTKMLKKDILKEKTTEFRTQLGIDSNSLVIGIHLEHSTNVSPELIDLVGCFARNPLWQPKVFLLVTAFKDNPKVIGLTSLLVRDLMEGSGMGKNYRLLNIEPSNLLHVGLQDLAFMLSESEPFSGVGWTALTMGVPCLSAASQVSFELFDNGRYGLTYQRKQAGSLEEQIARVLAIKQEGLDMAGQLGLEKRRAVSLSKFSKNVEALLARLAP